MECQRVLLLGGIQLAPNGELVAARDVITGLAFLNEASPLPMRGLALFAELLILETENDTVPVIVTLDGPHGTATLLDQPLSFGTASDGSRGARLTLMLDQFAFPKLGSYDFKIAAGGATVSTFSLSARILEGPTFARFASFIQDEQGILGTDRYLSARLPFLLQDSKSNFGGYHLVQLNQKSGDNFEVDALELKFAPGGEPLAGVYDFRVAAHRAYDFYAKTFFGGSLGEGSSIHMSNNLIQQEHPELFQMPDLSGGMAW